MLASVCIHYIRPAVYRTAEYTYTQYNLPTKSVYCVFPNLQIREGISEHVRGAGLDLGACCVWWLIVQVSLWVLVPVETHCNLPDFHSVVEYIWFKLYWHGLCFNMTLRCSEEPETQLSHLLHARSFLVMLEITHAYHREWPQEGCVLRFTHWEGQPTDGWPCSSHFVVHWK